MWWQFNKGGCSVASRWLSCVFCENQPVTWVHNWPLRLWYTLGVKFSFLYFFPDVKIKAIHPETSNGGSSSARANRMKKHMRNKLNGYSNELNESNIEMSKLELLKLLSIFEGELQARDEVIDMLTKQPKSLGRWKTNLNWCCSLVIIEIDMFELIATANTQKRNKRNNKGKSFLKIKFLVVFLLNSHSVTNFENLNSYSSKSVPQLKTLF